MADIVSGAFEGVVEEAVDADCPSSSLFRAIRERATSGGKFQYPDIQSIPLFPKTHVLRLLRTACTKPHKSKYGGSYIERSCEGVNGVPCVAARCICNAPDGTRLREGLTVEEETQQRLYGSQPFEVAPCYLCQLSVTMAQVKKVKMNPEATFHQPFYVSVQERGQEPDLESFQPNELMDMTDPYTPIVLPFPRYTPGEYSLGDEHPQLGIRYVSEKKRVYPREMLSAHLKSCVGPAADKVLFGAFVNSIGKDKQIKATEKKLLKLKVPETSIIKIYRETPLSVVLKLRIDFLHHLIYSEMYEAHIQYHAVCFLDQHIPLIKAYGKAKGNINYAQLYSMGADPDKVDPPSEDKFKHQGLYGIHEITSDPPANKDPDIFSRALKVIIRSALPVNLRDLLMGEATKHAALKETIVACLLGNYRGARRRAPVHIRFRVYGGKGDDFIKEIVERSPLVVHYALYEYIQRVLARGSESLLRLTVNLSDFYKRTSSVCDEVIRKFIYEDHQRAITRADETAAHKMGRKTAHLKWPRQSEEVFVEVLKQQSRKRKIPADEMLPRMRDYAFSSHHDILEASVLNSDISNKAREEIFELFGSDSPAPKKSAIDSVVNKMDTRDLASVTRCVIPLLKKSKIIIKPLSHVHKEQQNEGDNSTQRRMCPLCHKTNFRVIKSYSNGKLPKEKTLTNNPYENFSLVCDSCEELPPGIPIDFEGYSVTLVGKKQTLLMCCRCHHIADKVTGMHGHPKYAFLCAICSQDVREGKDKPKYEDAYEEYLKSINSEIDNE